MNIHEYQAKSLLKQAGIAVPDGLAARNVDEAVEAAGRLGLPVVVKAQIHAGGRGKAGGVRMCRRLEEVSQAASDLLGHVLVTAQTGSEGKTVHLLYLERCQSIVRELYLSLLIDREAEAVALVASTDGGTDIEEVAKIHPERILTRPLFNGPSDVTPDLSDFLSLPALDVERLVEMLYQLFIDKDCSLIELNPLAVNDQGELVALDAKIVFDDNALFRHPELEAMRDPLEEDPREREAREFGLNYIALDGRIGCMVNGAGLAMATMDIIQLKGDRPANFLDVGGGVTEQAVAEAFRLLLGDTHVRSILVNIFGGIVRCDIIARGLLDAVKTHPMRVPVVMRLVGTNEQEGRQLVKQAGLDVRWAGNLDEAAEMAVAAAREGDPS
ncbi:MAG: ADP-forming succinate--CoA ligase subunit beta [Zetaproteobacteria bacterium]|nr:MAG: ADP-forming succinate--CoA ligase subunit beta [Zetaproteobacteria bacterium]